MKKILVLESDGMVVDALANEFAAFGCMVDAVDDAEMARQKASSDSFVLVVISTTLAKSHGFLAFTFLKRLPELERTPFVIMYNEGEADQIASHQNRPTHADLYIQKPFDFNELLVSVAGYLGIEDQLAAAAGNGAARESTEEIVLDDAEVINAEGEEIAIDDTEVQSLAEMSDDEIAALDTPTEEAFVAGAGPSAAEPAAEPEPGALDTVDEATLAAAARESDGLKARIRELEGEASAASDRAMAAEKAQKAAEQEVDTVKTKVADLEKALAGKGSSSVSTRELLDLRELINRKDKEILNLKDDANAKEKELLAERDKLTDQLRNIADFEDKVAALDKEVSSLSTKVAALTKDKDTASKRAEDFKAHWEAAKEEIVQLKAEAEAAREAHAAELVQMEQILKRQGEEATEQALKELGSRLNDEKGAEIGSLKISHERALQELKDQYEAEIVDIRDKFENDLNEATQKAEKDRKEALAAQLEEYEGKLIEAETAAKAHEEQLEEEVHEKERMNKALMKETASQEKQNEELMAQKSALEDKVSELDAKVADLTAAMEKTSAELLALKAHAEGLTSRLEQSRTHLDGAEKHIGQTDDLMSDLLDNLHNVTTLLGGRERYKKPDAD